MSESPPAGDDSPGNDQDEQQSTNQGSHKDDLEFGGDAETDGIVGATIDEGSDEDDDGDVNDALQDAIDEWKENNPEADEDLEENDERLVEAQGFEDFLTDEDTRISKVADRLGRVVEMEEDGDYGTHEAISNIARTLNEHYAFVMPRKETDGIRQCLHVYEPESGIYRPYGEEFIGELLQELISWWLTEHRLREIRKHIERSNYIGEGDIGGGDTEIVVQNGIVDWETGDFREHSPDDVFLSRVEMPWQGIDATCPRWQEFFETVVADEHVETMYHIFAHCLVDAYPDEKAFMFVNDGGGGKSTTIEMWEHALGEEQVSNETLRALSSTNDTYAEAELYGKRANFGAEMDAGTKTQLETFKALTGGDRISARFPYEGKFKFRNCATIITTLNTMPDFVSDKDALWRRMVMIPFPNNFEDGEMADQRKSKQQLRDELLTDDELAGLLARSIRHTKQASDDGGGWFPDVEPMWERRKRIKASADPVFAWQDVCLVEDEGGKVPIEEAHECYRKFAQEEGLSTGIEGRASDEARSKFGEKLHGISDLEFETARRRFDGERKGAYIGVSFSPRGLQVLEDERSGEKILGSIEGQQHDENEQDSESDGGDAGDERRAGMEVTAKSIITHLNEQNDSEATHRAIVEHCRGEANLDGVLDALDTLEERGTVETDENGVYRVVESNGDGVGKSAHRRVIRGIVDSMSHDMETVAVRVVEGKLHSSPLGQTEINAVLEELDDEGYVVLSDGGDRVTLVESASEILSEGDA